MPAAKVVLILEAATASVAMRGSFKRMWTIVPIVQRMDAPDRCAWSQNRELLNRAASTMVASLITVAVKPTPTCKNERSG